jgi:hypothetical protein
MCSSTMTEGGTAVASRGGWCTLAEVSRILGQHPSSIKSMALMGALRFRSVPGARILYSRSDAERLSQGGSSDEHTQLSTSQP